MIMVTVAEATMNTEADTARQAMALKAATDKWAGANRLSSCSSSAACC